MSFFRRGLFMLAAAASTPLFAVVANATPIEMIGSFTGTTTSITDSNNTWGLKATCSGQFGCAAADPVSGSFYYYYDASTNKVGASQVSLTLNGITHVVAGQGLAVLFQSYANSNNGVFQLLPDHSSNPNDKNATTSLAYAGPGWFTQGKTTLTTNEIFTQPSASEGASEFDFGGSSVRFYVDSMNVPEPMSVALLSVGLAGVGAVRRRRLKS